MAWLKIIFRGAETVVGLHQGETSVGRSNRSTIRLPDPGIAPVQFRIDRRAKGFRVKDDGSGTPTKVNGRTVFATTLRHGDRIEAGGLLCVFLDEPEAPAGVRPPAPSAEPPVEPLRRSVPGQEVERHERPRARARASAIQSGKSGLYAGLAAAVAAVFIVGFFLMRGSDEEEAAALYKAAVARSADSRQDPAGAEAILAESVEMLLRVRREYPGTRVSGTAEVALAEAQRVLNALEDVRAEARLAPGIESEDDAQESFLRLARLRGVTHPAVERLVLEVEMQLREARSRRLEESFGRASDEAEKLYRERRYGDALRVWREFEIGDYFIGRRAEEAARALDKRVVKEYRGVLRLAGRNEGIDGRIGLLEASRDTFRGTGHAEDLEVRIAALKARKRHLEAVVLRKTESGTPTTPSTPEPGQPAPETGLDTGPYEDPPKVATLIEARRYGEAASTLQGISRHPAAQVRVEELTLLAQLMANLVAAISAEPERFDQVLLPRGEGRGDAAGADAQSLTVRRDSGEKAYRWADMPAKSFVRLFRQAELEKPPSLAAALFFDEELLPKEAAKRYVAVFRAEQAPETFRRILARRRGIEPPAEGFLLFRGAIVTPDEKRTLLLRERIARLARDARSTTASRRRSAWDELESIGEPATGILVTLFKERRLAAIDELKRAKAFSPQRFVARFGQELEQRRKHALAFIMDPVAYPYPNKTEPAQKEAEKRVDAVRELYERPYELLLRSSDEAGALDAEIRELDARLARKDPLSEPLHESAVAEVVAKLDMRNVAIDERDRKRIDYNHEVTAYNRGLKETTISDEERANVAAVNEYRWMMGRLAVKIDERLVRASRKHSIEMAQLEYFAHDSPTASLRSPGMRAKRDGYGGGVSENIARGANSGVHAFWVWFRSSGHHRNMLIANHREMGCGTFRDHWWTQMFGRLTGKSMNPPRIPPDPDPPGQSGNGMPAPGAKE